MLDRDRRGEDGKRMAMVGFVTRSTLQTAVALHLHSNQTWEVTSSKAKQEFYVGILPLRNPFGQLARLFMRY